MNLDDLLKTDGRFRTLFLHYAGNLSQVEELFEKRPRLAFEILQKIYVHAQDAERQQIDDLYLRLARACKGDLVACDVMDWLIGRNVASFPSQPARAGGPLQSITQQIVSLGLSG